MGNTGRSSWLGSTRATNCPSWLRPSSVQAASSTSVSDDIPFASVPLSSATSGSDPSGRTVASQPPSRAGTSAASRLVRWSFMSAGGAPWVTGSASLERVLVVNGSAGPGGPATVGTRDYDA